MKIKEFWDKYRFPIVFAVFIASVASGFTSLVRSSNSAESNNRKTKACERIVEVGVGSTFNKHHK